MMGTVWGSLVEAVGVPRERGKCLSTLKDPRTVTVQLVSLSEYSLIRLQ